MEPTGRNIVSNQGLKSWNMHLLFEIRDWIGKQGIQFQYDPLFPREAFIRPNMTFMIQSTMSPLRCSFDDRPRMMEEEEADVREQATGGTEVSRRTHSLLILLIPTYRGSVGIAIYSRPKPRAIYLDWFSAVAWPSVRMALCFQFESVYQGR